MRISQFWELMNDEFGQSYASSVVANHHLSALGSRTAAQALDEGIAPRAIWRAICDDLDVPDERRLGRDVPPRR